MAEPAFNPGFRLSALDCVILLAGIVGAISLGLQIWWVGMMIAWIVLHFFCFCNVFRISRTPEQIWAAAFIILVIPTILIGVPGWPLTMGLSLVFSTMLIWQETRKPHYHGVFWKCWNPSLPEW
tara:strand:- start:2234 stop:2605 length:372 start_codon:yes stop_codon:yes gene_type:complete